MSRTYDMIDIVHCLAQFPHPQARQRLQDLERSRNYLVAYSAERAQQWYDQEQEGFGGEEAATREESG